MPSWEDKDRYFIVLGEVIGIHIRDEYLTDDGLVNIEKINPIGRMGYNDYTSVSGSTIFTMVRPDCFYGRQQGIDFSTSRSSLL